MGNTRGVYAGNILTFKDSVMSPAQGTTPWENFPMQTVEDPGTGFCLYDEFECNNTTKTTDIWQVVKGTGGSITLPAKSMGWISVPTAASSNDYQCFFTNAAIFALQNNCLLAWEAMINVTEANTNKSSWFAGFTSVTTTGFLQNTGVPPTSYSGAVIYKTTSAMAVNAQTSNGSTQNTTSSAIATAVSGTTLIVGMSLNPNDNVTGIVTWYVSNVVSNVRTPIASGTLNLTLASLAAMYFGFGVRAGSASAETITLDYIQAAQGRYYQ